jgi:hypothetical protein
MDRRVDYFHQKNVKAALSRATPEEKRLLQRYNLPFTRAFNSYSPSACKILRERFWEDAALDGITSAIVSWKGLLNA